MSQPNTGLELTCPHCESNVAIYNPKKKYWRCSNLDCDETFEGPPPVIAPPDEEPAFKAQNVFISNGHDDNTDLVKALKARLERAGHQLWIDYEKIDHAQDWRAQIVDGIKQCDRVLSFLSKRSVRDPGVCLDEIGIALADRHGAIATLLVEPENEVQAPASVSHIQYLNLSKWNTVRMEGEASWGAWLDEKSAIILEIIARESGFAGEMDTLRRELHPLAQHQFLGGQIKQHFVGRSWVFEALETWRRSPPTQRLFMISGAPGMGKSMISAHLAHYSRLHAAAYHFCRWDSDESKSPHAFVCNLAYQLAARFANYRSNLRDKVVDLVSQKPLVEWSADDLFAQLINEAGAAAIDGGQNQDRALVVIDALDEAPEIARLLSRIFSKIGTQPATWLGFVVTTRPEKQIPESLGAYARHFPLRSDDQENQRDLAAYLADWSAQLPVPLSDDIRTALLERSEGSIYYLVLAREDSLNGTFDVSRADSFPAGLSGWYEAWFARQFDNDPAAWERAKPLLRLLCACPEPLPLTVVTNVLNWRDEDDLIVLRPFGALISWDNQQVRLSHRSFAEWMVATQGGYRINPSEGRLQLAGYFWARISQLLKARTSEFGHWMLPQLIEDMTSEQRQEFLAKDRAGLNKLRRLMKVLGGFQSYRIRRSRLALSEQIFQVCEAQFGDAAEQTLKAKLHWTVLRLDFSNDYAQARKVQGKILADYRRIHGNEHPDTLVAMSVLAKSLRGLGEFATARELREQIVTDRTRLFGAEHADTLVAMNNLSILLLEMGEHAAARELQARVLADRKRLQGEEHADTLTAMSSFATVLRELGDFAGARELQARVLADRKRLLGEADLQTVSAMSSLAIVLREAGDLAEARKLLEQVVADRKRLQGDGHADTLTAMSLLATVLRELEEYAAARDLLERVLADRKRLLGEGHLDTVMAMSHLGGVLGDLKENEAARELQEGVQAHRERILGEGHPETITAKAHLAVTLSRMGEYARARELHECVVECRKAAWGETHPGTLLAMDYLAFTLRNMGDLPGARELQERVLAEHKRRHGDAHEDTLTTMGFLAMTLKHQGHHVDARALQERVLAGRTQLLGEEHADTLQAMDSLALTLVDLNDLRGTRELREKLLALQTRVLGETHKDTCTTMLRLSGNLREEGDFQGARAMQEKLLAIRTAALGEEHADTLAVRMYLARTVSALNQHGEARALWEEVLSFQEYNPGYANFLTQITLRELVANLKTDHQYPALWPVLEKLVGECERLMAEDDRDSFSLLQTLVKALSDLASLPPADLQARALAIANELCEQGALDDARPLLERFIALRERLQGGQHAETLEVIEYLAEQLMKNGESAAAIPMLEKAHAARVASQGPDHPDTLTTLGNLACAVADDDLPRARAMQTRLMADRIRVSGETHPATLAVMLELARTYKSLRELAEARPLEERVLAVRTEELGAEHQDTLDVMRSLANTERLQGDLPGAQKRLEKVLALCRSSKGEEHSATVAAMNMLATVMLERQDFAGARQWREKVLQVQTKTRGPNHPLTKLAMKNVSVLLNK